MDGSTTIPTFTLTVAACWAIGHPIAVHNGQWRCTETECTTEPVTSDRPVMPVVARMLDDGEYSAARLAAMNAWRHATGALREALGGSRDASADGFRVQVGCVVDDLGRMSEAVRRFFLDVEPALRAEVQRLRAEVEQHAGDTAAIGTLAAAVGKVAQLHTDDGDGWCKACQTIGYPCPTVLALGAGQ